MEQLQTFFDANKKNLTQILITERTKQGYGALFVELKRNKDETPERINCYYLKMIAIPQKVREDLIKKYHDSGSDKNMLYFVLFDKNNSIIIEYKQ